MAEMLKHDAAVACYGRWDDQDKVWNDASLMLGAYKKAAIISDVIVDTPEEIEALPDDQEVITPVENVMGPVIDEEKVFRPAAWNAFGMDKEGQDYRACQAYGPMYK